MAVYGIDFGTCNSCIAAAEDHDRITVIPSASARNTTPSVVMFNNAGKPTVGDTAKRALSQTNTTKVVAFIKTEMANEQTSRRYQVSANTLRPLSPIEPAACIFRQLFTQANTYRTGIGAPVIQQAVITVPAVCSNIQREKTKIAAELAGIQVLKIIDEPTAAAISYQLQVGETIMVFDLGGGTLDVSIIRRNTEEDYQVLSTEGNPRLGGKNWDARLIELAYENAGLEFTEECITSHHLLNFEQVKIDLCAAGYQEIFFVDHDGVQQQVEVTLEEFEQYTDNLVQESLQVIRRALQSAGADPHISRICLAGGSSRMPAIRRAICHQFPTIRVDLSDPDQAIAKGAARFAYSISSGSTDYNIDERGHAYGLISIGQDGCKHVCNLIQRSDQIQIAGLTFERWMPQTGNRLHVTIIENDQNRREFRYRKDLQPFFDDDVIFPMPLPIGERVEFSLSRDDNGLVHLSVIGLGHRHELQFATQADRIPPTIRQQVEALLALM